MHYLTGYKVSKETEKELEHHYYSMRCYTDLSIRLHRNHIPLHRKLCITKQSDYDYYIAMLHYLRNQIDMGFKPRWLITLHYQHPTEHAKPFKETNNHLGFKDRINFKTKRNIWYEDALYKYWDAKRNDAIQIEQDVLKLKSRILRYFFKVKRLDRCDKYDFPNIYFFNEKGKAKQKFHTHIVLPDALCYNTKEEMHEVFNTTIRNRLTSASTWQPIDVSEINSMYDIFGYLNKETKSNFLAYDFINSIPIIK